MKNKTIIPTLFIVIINLLSPEIGFSQNKKRQDPDESKKPITNYVEWTGSDEQALYKNCIISLHIANLDIDPVRTGYGKEIGQIFSDSIKYRVPSDFKASYKLSLIVYKSDENKMSLHIIVVNPKILIGSQHYVNNVTFTVFNNIIAGDIEKFLAQLEILQGKAITTKTTTIDIQYNGL